MTLMAQGHPWRWNFRQLCMPSYIHYHLKDFLSHWSVISKVMCKPQDQGHTRKSNVRQLCGCSLHPISLKGFSSNLAQMLTSIRLYAEPMPLLCWLKVTSKSQLPANFNFCVSSMNSKLLDWHFENLLKWFISKIRIKWTYIKSCDSSVKFQWNLDKVDSDAAVH
jgi:hypothetical protein